MKTWMKFALALTVAAIGTLATWKITAYISNWKKIGEAFAREMVTGIREDENWLNEMAKKVGKKSASDLRQSWQEYLTFCKKNNVKPFEVTYKKSA